MDACNCLYCNGEGPYYENGLLIHFCEKCHREYTEDDGMGCGTCAAEDDAMERMTRRSWRDLN